MQVLKRGHTELFRRGPDECFDSLAGLTRFCQGQKEKSVDRWVPPRSLRPRPLALDKLVIDFADPGAKQSEEAYQMNDWSFTQLCQLAKVSRDTVNQPDKVRLFMKKEKGRFSLTLERGGYFAKRRVSRQLAAPDETMVHEPLRSLGFDDGGIRWLVRTFSMTLLREWTDIGLAAKERFTASFFKKSPQAWLVDNLKNAAAGRRTPPDWWHDQRRTEHRARATTRPSSATFSCELPNLPDESRQAFEKIAAEMFSVFLKMGQPENVAKANAEKFAQECAQRDDSTLAEPLKQLFKS